MDHSQVRKLLSAYMDGELDRSLAKKVQEHINQCDACARYLESLRMLDGSLRSTKPEMPAEGYFEFFPQKLRARMRAKQRAPAVRGRLEVRLARIRVGATALIVLMAFGIGFLYGQREVVVPMPKVSPIPVVPELAPEVSAPLTAYDVTSTAEVLSRPKEKVADEIPIPRLVEKEGRGAEPLAPSVDDARAKRAKSREMDKAAGIPTETPVLSGERDALGASRKDYKKSEEELTPATRYAQANVAQLDGDYSFALDEYAQVLKDSPGTDLASAAQFQMNVITAGPDTTAGVEALRVAASTWRDYIDEYPDSRLIRPACSQYTENLYLIARRTKSRSDATRALSAIKECSELIKEKLPPDFKDRSEELKAYLRG